MIKHFSDTVQYDSQAFLEKNRDTVSKELVNVLQESDMSLCQKIMEIDDLEEAKASKSNQSLGGRVTISASKTLVCAIIFHQQNLIFFLSIKETSN